MHTLYIYIYTYIFANIVKLDIKKIDIKIRLSVKYIH